MAFFQEMASLGFGDPLARKFACDNTVTSVAISTEAEADRVAKEKKTAGRVKSMQGDYDDILPHVPVPSMFKYVPRFEPIWQGCGVPRQSIVFSTEAMEVLLKEFSHCMESLLAGKPYWRTQIPVRASAIAKQCGVSQSGQDITEEQVKQWFRNQINKRGWWNVWTENIQDVLREERQRHQEHDPRTQLLTTAINAIDSVPKKTHKTVSQLPILTKQKRTIRTIQSLKRKSECAEHTFANFQEAVFNMQLTPEKRQRSEEWLEKY